MRQFINEVLKLGSNMTNKNEVEQKPMVIKLGSNPAKEQCLAALEEWEEMTHPHPLDRNSRLTDAASIDVSYFDGALHLGHVAALGAPRQGGGGRAVKMLCDLADKHNVKITLTAKSTSDERMNTAQLRSWYGRFGFHDEEDSFGDDHDGWDMIRFPNVN